MLLVRQRYRFDCGVAAVATVTQVPYDAVLDRLVSGLSSTEAMSEVVVWRTLQDITRTPWCMEELWSPWPQVGGYSFSAAPTIVLIQRADGSRHYIAVCGGQVYDPLMAVPLALTEYPDRGSYVVTVFRAGASEGDSSTGLLHQGTGDARWR
ncbi:MAG: hypothetical protein ACJ8F7_06835 [Gemmataceae bacterium]